MIAVDERLLPLPQVLTMFDSVLPFAGGTLTNNMLQDSQADAIIIRSTTQVTPQLLAHTKVRFVATATSGTDHMDVPWLTAQGIRTEHAAGTNANAVAEWVLAMLLELDVPTGSTIGIVGYGHVGGCVQRLCNALGLSTLVCDPPRVEAGQFVPDACSLETLLNQCSVVSLHVPLTTQGRHATANMLNQAAFMRMKSNATLLNAARGGVVHQAAASAWISNGGTIVADTFCDEPNVDSDFVLRCRWATPHVAGHTLNAFVDAARVVGSAWCAWRGFDATAVNNACNALATPPRRMVAAEQARDICKELRQRRPLLADAEQFRILVEHGGNVGPRFAAMRSEYKLRLETYLC